MTVKNAKGKVFYGMHFYPGLAEYQPPGEDPHRVYLNENTLRSMDPSFAGCPVFVEHVDEVNEDINKLRAEADGWVLESFFNHADGKHWVKFIVVSDYAEQAIAKGFRLSNAYVPTGYTSGGLWNGITYEKEVTGGKFDHLAIVRHPRYEESVIKTPEQFKLYNEEKLLELKRLANSKDKNEGKSMALNLFKRTKVENAADLAETRVVLPKSGKEMTITELVEAHDKVMNMHGYASGDHMVKVGDDEMSVNDLVKRHMSLNDELAAMKKNDEEIEEGSAELGDHGGDKSLENAEEGEDAEAAKKAKDDEKKKNALEVEAKAKAAREKAAKLKNAGPPKQVVEEKPYVVDFSADKVQRGKDRY